jgi:hypothetical protein
VTDLDKQNGSLEYKLYPNPNQGSFTVDFGEFVDDVRIRILNSLGQTVHEEQVRQERIIQLDVDLSPAYYFMEVSTQDQRSVKPLIIKK